MMNSMVKYAMVAVTAGTTGLGLGPSSFAAIIVQPTLVTTTSPTAMKLDWLPVQVIDGSGLTDATVVANGATIPTVLPTHYNGYTDLSPLWDNSLRWRATLGSDQKYFGGGESMTFTLDKTYNLEGVYLWNYGENGGSAAMGIKGASIEFSGDGGRTWSTASTLTFNPATFAGDKTVAQYQVLGSHSANAVRITITANFGAAESSGTVGLGEIRFTAIP